MKKLFLLLPTSIFILLFSCSSPDKPDDGSESLIKAKGDRYYGGVFRLNESEYLKNLFPHNITDAYSYRIACQIYEGLFKFDDETLQVIPALAESYEINQAGSVYTIKLKEGIYFHDDPCFEDSKGREVTAEDVKYCFTRLCTQNINNQLFSSIFKDILKGANEYYMATQDGQMPNFGVSGIKVLDKYSFQLSLVKPNSLFLVNLSMPGCFIYPREAEEKYGLDMRIKAVGTGPFVLSGIDEDISIILKKNPEYHGMDEYGNQLPFLDALSIQFIKDKKTELFEFKKRNLDMIYRLPTDYILEILDPDTLKPVPAGKVGEMVVTTLCKEAAPLIRYRTRDLTRLIGHPCSCGNILPMHDRILGRSDDMLIYRAVNIYPGQIDEVLSVVPDIGCEYQVILDRSDDGRDYMTLRLECCQDTDTSRYPEIAKKVTEAIKKQIMVSCQVEVVDYCSLPRSERKSRRVFDNRPE